MRYTPELRRRAIRTGKIALFVAGALGFATIFAPMAVDSMVAANEKSAEKFRETGGSDISKVEGTNLYTITPNSSASEARTKTEVMNKALIQIAKTNPGCELSTPWQIPMSAGSNKPNQLDETYYVSIHCPSRIAR